jgi:arylformamidase
VERPLVHDGLTQAELDTEYDCRATVADYHSYLDRRETMSGDARARFDGILDVSYGPSRDEVLDVFPARGDGRIQMFVHGGYWRANSKDGSSYLAAAFVPLGVSTVVVNHSLAPAVSLSEIVAQIRRAFVWVAENARSFGGDGQRVFVSGHSSGGHLAAMLLASDWDGPVPIRGACLMSGLYDLRPVRLSYVNEWLKLNDVDAESNSPILRIGRTETDLIVAVSGRDTNEFRRQSRDYCAEWLRVGNQGRFVDVRRANHYSVVDRLLDPRSVLALAVWEQMQCSS